MRKRRAEYENDPAELDRMLAKGAEQAKAFAIETMQGVRKIMNIS